MKGKTWLAIIIVLLVLTGIGGKMYMDKREAEKQADLIEAERMSVKALKNTFADIKSVEFEKSSYNVMTGSYTMFVKMTNSYKKYVNFEYLFTINQSNEIDGWTVVDENGVQKKGETKNKVEVIYSDRSKGEL